MKQEARVPKFKERLNSLLGECSVTEFAKTLGISRQTLGFYLNGDRIPDIETLTQICERCSVSADWLLGLSNEPSPDMDFQAISKKLGLGEDAVKRINKMEPGERELINRMINHIDFWDVIGQLKEAEDCVIAFEKGYRGVVQEKSIEFFEKFGCVVLPPNKTANYYIDKAADQFSWILHQIVWYNDYLEFLDELRAKGHNLDRGVYRAFDTETSDEER